MMNNNDSNKTLKNMRATNKSSKPITNSHPLDDECRTHLTGMTLETGRNFFNTMKDNVSDYKTIEADPNLTSTDKAIGKRKILALDILLSFGTIGGTLGLMWLAKKAFTT